MPTKTIIETPLVKYTAPYELTLARDGDAGYDLRANLEGIGLILRPGNRALIGTGVRLELPTGYAAFVLPRSGWAVNHGITLLNSPGLIDNGYRGEVCALLINHGVERVHIQPGDRIAQLVPFEIAPVMFAAADALEESERGEGGFGSTGQD